jgi:hypothetical protein
MPNGHPETVKEWKRASLYLNSTHPSFEFPPEWQRYGEPARERLKRLASVPDGPSIGIMTHLFVTGAPGDRRGKISSPFTSL